MKVVKFLAACLVFASLSTSSFAAHGGKKKKHVCNKECTKDKHALKCGEKGHKCTDDCKKKEEKM
jgi:hypothetical protein